MTFDGFMVWSNLCPSCYGNTGRLLPFSYLLVEKFSCSAIFSKREFAVVSNLRFSRTNFMLSLVVLVEHEKTFYNLGARSNLLVMYGMLHCFSVSLEQIQLIKPMLLFSGFFFFFVLPKDSYFLVFYDVSNPNLHCLPLIHQLCTSKSI